jgi:hypothetical protein
MERHDHCADTMPGDGLYAIVLRADGATEQLTRPITLGQAHELIGADALDVPTVAHPWLLNELMSMFLDDLGHRTNLPVNERATILYGSTAGWQIRGDVIVCSGELDQPLSDQVVELLLDDHTFELLLDDIDELPDVTASESSAMVEVWPDAGSGPERPHGAGRGDIDPPTTRSPWPPPTAMISDPTVTTRPLHEPGWRPPVVPPPTPGLSR